MSTVTLICTNSMPAFFSSSGSESAEIETDNEEEETVMLEKQPSLPQRKHLVRKENVKKEKARKQYVEVDKRGHSYGTYLIEDVKSFAKGLNPCYGWNDQPMDEKDRFFERLYVGNVS